MVGIAQAVVLGAPGRPGGQRQAGTYVAGDQIITNIYEAPPLPLRPAAAKGRHHLTILLNKAKTFWIEGVPEKSVHLARSLR